MDDKGEQKGRKKNSEAKHKDHGIVYRGRKAVRPNTGKDLP